MTTRTCMISGCNKNAAARGWCWAHYGRWRRHGDPEIVKPPGSVPPPIWIDPLTDDDYHALQASVDADARKLLPYALQIVGELIGVDPTRS